MVNNMNVTQIKSSEYSGQWRWGRGTKPVLWAQKSFPGMFKGFKKKKTKKNNFIKKMLNQDKKMAQKSKSASKMEETRVGGHIRERSHGLGLTKPTM